MSEPLIDIRPDQWVIVRDILQKHVPQCDVWAFGSRAKWSAKEYSDLDLAVITDKPLGLSVSAALADDFSESDLPFKVDVVDWATTSEAFRKIIERDKVVVWRGEKRTIEGAAGERQAVPFERLLVEPVRNGIYKTKEFHGRGAKIVNMGELFAHPRLRAVPMKRVELSPSETARFMLAEGDLIFARRSLTAEGAGKCSVVLELDEPTTFESSIIRARPDRLKAEPLYLYYFFNSTAGFHSLDTIRRQVAVAGITGSDLSRLEIPAPHLPEQRAIAHILGTLDDKIELNRRMNETLEAMARALFKSWFVDFDPVRAKAEGRDPGLPKPLVDLFPDSFEDSELWEIPKGSNLKVLDDLIAVVLGGDWGGDEPTQEKTMATRCIRGADIPDLQAGGTGKMPLRYLKPSSLDKRRLKNGDLVVEISGGSPTQSTGRPVLVSDQLLSRLDAPLVCSNFCRLLKLKKPTYSRFVYLWLRSLYANDEFLQYENGTTGIKNFAFTLFCSGYKFSMPPEVQLTAFDFIVAPLFEKLQANAAEADTLATLRDTLLPKLISGEIRIQDIDHSDLRVA